MLHAAGLLPPSREFVQGHITKNGRKLSKTTGNVIVPDALIDRLGADAVRYFLLREAPYGQDWDYTDASFVGRYNSDLANDLGNLVSRALTRVARYCDGKVRPRPAPGSTAAIQEQWRRFLATVTALPGQLAGWRRARRPGIKDPADGYNGFVHFPVPAASDARLREAARRLGVTVNDLLFAIVLKAVAPLWGGPRPGARRSEVAVASVVNVRDDFDRERLQRLSEGAEY